MDLELVILTLTFALLVIQLFFQHKIFIAQLHRDRFELYWKIYEPVTEDHVQDLKVAPESYMTVNLHEEKYKEQRIKIMRYIHMARAYEYLAFTYAGLDLRYQKNSRSDGRSNPKSTRLNKVFIWYEKMLAIKDPLGNNWIEQYTDDLMTSDEFKDAHNVYGKYYPDYAAFVDRKINLQGGASGVRGQPTS
jgi:hypothetical protein